MSAGVLFLVLGVLLFFDATLLALGNVLFTAGIALLIGPQKTFLFFARKNKIRGTICFFAGMVLVFFRYSLMGMTIEMVGFLNLLGCVVAYQRLFPCNPQLLAPGPSSWRCTIASCRAPGYGPTCGCAAVRCLISANVCAKSCISQASCVDRLQ